MNHTWIKQVFVPIEAELRNDGIVHIHIDRTLEKECMRSNNAFGCVACGVPLIPDTINTPCRPLLNQEVDTPQQIP